MSTLRLSHAEHHAHFQACFALMQVLRPHLTDADAFIEQLRRQRRQGYCLLVAWQADEAIALAGYRVLDNFIYGRFLYVDDLVSHVEARRLGVGAELLNALREEARQLKCAHLVLDTALSNTLGQRFYYRQGLLARGLHFVQPL